MFQRTFFFSCALVVVDLVGDSATTHCNILPPMAVIRLGMLVARIILLRQAHKTKAGHWLIAYNYGFKLKPGVHRTLLHSISP